MSRQKHDLGHIKKTRAPSFPSKSKQDKRKAKSERIAKNYARAEATFMEAENKRRGSKRYYTAVADTTP